MSPNILISQAFFAHENPRNEFLFKVSTGETEPLNGIKHFDKNKIDK